MSLRDNKTFETLLKNHLSSIKKTLSNKKAVDLAAYAAAGGLLAAPGVSTAAIVYTEPPNPITVSAFATGPGNFTQQAFFDVNGDGSDDFRLRAFRGFDAGTGPGTYHKSGRSSVRGYGLAGFSFLAGTSGGLAIRALDSNYLISALKIYWNQCIWGGPLGVHFTTSWQTGGTTYTQDVSYGFWPNAGTKFMGIRFRDNAANLHYGWVRVRLTNCHSVTVLDWAYETEEDKAIGAGRGMPTPVPSLNDWGRTVFILILAALALKMMKKKQSRAA